MIDDLLERCLHRHKNPSESVRTRWQHRAVSYAAAKTINPEKLSRAGLSFLPISKKGNAIERWRADGKNWETRYGVQDWKPKSWRESYGIQIFTGKPSEYLTDLDFEYAIVRDHPEILVSTLQQLCTLVDNPLLVISKSGGVRFSCRTPGYVHQKRDQMAVAVWENHRDHKHLYLEIFGEKGLSRYDARYEIFTGSLLDIPVVDHQALLEIVNELRQQIGTPRPEKRKSIPKSTPRSEKQVYKTILIVDGLPSDLRWIKRKDGSFESARGDYPCQVTNHKNSDGAAQYYQQVNGQIDAFCHNCKQPWIVKKADTPQRRIDKVPLREVRETPSFPYFSEEERTVVDKVLRISPDAGWHGHTPVFSTKYEHLSKLTNKFALNGQPNEVEKRRVWSTLFENCEICGATTAKWVDRYQLKAGYYCDGCHTDYPLGSYLELELARKLPNSIKSDYHGFLGDDPEFRDFRLWEPGIMTHLGAGMATGKSTEIYKAMIALALQKLGKGIIVVPRVSLARFLAHYLRQRDGYRAWGLWHEGVRRADRFIGEYGAIVCLPSLPRAVQSATNAGAKRLYIAIDEVDFAYNLLSLSVEQATAVKKCLRDAIHTTGLVVSGQTESTLSLEALASELESEQVQGFYNTAQPSDGNIVMHRYADLEGKSNAVLAGAIDDISDFLSAGHNVYTFCSSRRDGDIIATLFADLNPVLYNASTKGDTRADAILKNQKLTDSPLFIATSAACVGISILDPNARTVVISGLVYGSLDANTTVQEFVRDRGRQGGSHHYAEYKLSLPLKPTENETVSLYHEALKIAENQRAHLPEAGIKKIARAQALASLADHQIENFISYHLGTVGNMPVHQASALTPSEDKIAIISERRRILIHDEREKKLATAILLLKTRNLLTSSEIRVRSNKGEMSPNQRLAYEAANGYAAAVGWDDTGDSQLDKPFDEILDETLDETDIHTAVSLAENNINVEKLAKQRRGYIAIHFPNWTAYTFQTALAHTENDLVNEGLGIEPTAIHDDRFRGKLLQVLINRLQENVFDTPSLAAAVREVLKQEGQNGKTFLGEINRGALGSSEYRRARFLHAADDASIVHWASQFVSEWYPARIQKQDHHFGLTHAKNLDLRLASFSRWLIHQPSVPESAQINLDIFQPTKLPHPNAERKTKARERRKSGTLLSEIASEFNISEGTASKWCKGISPAKQHSKQTNKSISDRTYRRRKEKPQSETKTDMKTKALEMKKDGHSITEIADILGKNKSTISRWLKPFCCKMDKNFPQICN